MSGGAVAPPVCEFSTSGVLSCPPQPMSAPLKRPTLRPNAMPAGGLHAAIPGDQEIPLEDVWRSCASFCCSATEENVERLANMIMEKAFAGDMAAAKMLL